MASPSASTAASVIRLAITTPDQTTDDRSVTIAGTLTDGTGSPLPGATVELDETGLAVGSATVMRDGTWSVAASLPNLGANTLTARTIDAGQRATTSAPVTITLDTVLSPTTHLSGSEPMQHLIRPAAGATVSSTSGSDTFVFRPHSGHVTIEGFDASSYAGDRLVMPRGAFDTFADVLRHTTMTSGDAVIHLGPREAITLVGITKAELRADPGAIVLRC